MASAVLLPKLGNSVESSIILAWHKAVGDPVATGDLLAEIETDKATLEVESPADGLLLARFYEAGAEVTVMAPIGAIGAAGEDVADLRPHASETTIAAAVTAAADCRTRDAWDGASTDGPRSPGQLAARAQAGGGARSAA